MYQPRMQKKQRPQAVWKQPRTRSPSDDARDLVARREHRADELVADREAGLDLHAAVVDVQVGPADAGRLDPHDRVVGGLELGLGLVLDAHLVGRLERDRSHVGETIHMASKAVLITGCSTGIGRKTAEHLAERGWTVYATARRPESIADLEQKGCRTLALDVTDEDSMQAAVTRGRGGRGRGRRARQQRRLQPVGRRRGGPDGPGAAPVRDERLRPAADVPARPARHAPPGLGQDREHLVDGRPARLPRRRDLPRHEVRGRGDQRRDALGGARTSASTWS